MKEVARMRDKLEEQMAATVEKCNSLLDIREVELPKYDEKISYMHGRVTQVNYLLLDKHFEEKNMVTKGLVFRAILNNLREAKAKKQQIRRMFANLSRFQVYHAFRRFERQARW